MACPTGIEPVTPSLEGWCSIRLSYGHHSNRILPHIRMNWSGWRDLNSRHPGPKPGALPGYATPRKGRYYTFPSVKGQFMAFCGEKTIVKPGLITISIRLTLLRGSRIFYRRRNNGEGGRCINTIHQMPLFMPLMIIFKLLR